MIKRTLDILFSLTGLLILFPFLLIISLMIKVDSRGPIFYLQKRVGMNGRTFRLVKFRSMCINADKLNAITVGLRDPRVTRVGYYARKFKIDELPQLINVLIGDMSLVGPRPELEKFVDLYDINQKKVLSVRPGITDPASIKFRNENELLEGKDDPISYYTDVIMPQKLALNLEYIEKQSMLFDLKLIFATVFSIFKRPA